MLPATRRRTRLSTGTELSYITAGDESKPALLLLHGFPSSARMFRDLIPTLSPAAHLIAPDLPGFGESDPLPVVTFAAFADAISELLDQLAIGPRYVYLHDFGAPVGLRIAMNEPGKVLGLVVQNANAHVSGFGPAWAATREYWANPTPDNEKAATAHLTRTGTRDQYLAGVPADVAARIPSASWEEDWRVMNLPGRLRMHRELVRDYGRYAARFDEITDYLKRRRPPALLLWGRHDAFFDIAEVESWMRDLPRMEAHIFDAGHMLLETHAEQAATQILAYLFRA